MAQVSYNEVKNVFVLPNEYLSSSQTSTSLILRKHLILVSEQGEMCFLNYNLRVLQSKVTFSSKPPKSIVHNYQNSIYVIVCERKVYIVDDITFNLKREIAGSFDQAAVNVDTKVLLLNESNNMVIYDTEDKNF